MLYPNTDLLEHIVESIPPVVVAKNVGEWPAWRRQRFSPKYEISLLAVLLGDQVTLVSIP